MQTKARRDRGSHRVEISRFSKITRNTARVTVHPCASPPRRASERAESSRLPRESCAAFCFFSSSRAGDAHLGARAAHLLPVSRPRCQDGAGDRPPERGRPLCQLRRLRERRRGRGKRRRQGGAAPHHLFRRVARARATAPPFAALAFPRAARVRTPPATDPPLDATRRASPHPARVRRCPAGAGPTETKARSATTPRRDSAARSETTTTRA